jgi:hypothetical protein
VGCEDPTTSTTRLIGDKLHVLLPDGLRVYDGSPVGK